MTAAPNHAMAAGTGESSHYSATSNVITTSTAKVVPAAAICMADVVLLRAK